MWAALWEKRPMVATNNKRPGSGARHRELRLGGREALEGDRGVALGYQVHRAGTEFLPGREQILMRRDIQHGIPSVREP